MFGEEPFEHAWLIPKLMGYSGVEIAPFTLLSDSELPNSKAIDVNDISQARREEVRRIAADTGLDVVGLHWLFAKTKGLHLTSPEQSVRLATTQYLRDLAKLCSDLGGQVMVLGSPQQRCLLPGVSHAEAERYAAEVLSEAMPVCSDLGVTIALEPLGPSEGDFLCTAESAIQLAKLVDSPRCKLLLDVKAMSSEEKPIEQVIRESRDWLVHFHANDPNLLGPGMGEVEYESIFRAINEVDYDGWISLEVFRYEPSPRKIALQSIEYMRKIFSKLFTTAD